MGSLITGYNYDIFISYRQKDNKGDRWVSEFVEALKTELESTFKEEVSVYFDINPHDGLLESYDVDASLKEKLKCLIFIPIISRTYCDPKSFAWEHELKAFVEMVSKDQFGLKVKLLNGNVSSRVLPVRIHNLDVGDIKECESVLGGYLRGVEFIYKEPGVDKPLAPDDDERKNLNHTKYRIQIIKVAHAIREIILGMKAEPVTPAKEKAEQIKPLEEVKKEEKKQDQKKPGKWTIWKLMAGIIVITALSVIAAILGYPKIFKRDTLDKLRTSGERISVAVMPFQNMTKDTTLDVYSDVIQTNLVNILSNFVEELKVRQSETVKKLLQSKELNDYASITYSVAGNISQKLDADIFIFGNIQQVGNTIRVYAQLINSKTEEIYKSFQIEASSKEEMNYHSIDSLSILVKDFLILSQLKQKDRPDFRKFEFTTLPKAYMYFNSGQKAIGKGDFQTARENFTEALKCDSDFILAIIYLAVADINLGLYVEGKEWCFRAYKKSNRMSDYMKNKLGYITARYTIGPQPCIKYLKQLIALDDQDPTNYHSLGWAYNALYQYDKAIPEFEKALDLWDKWGSKPMWVFNYTIPGYAYHKTGQSVKEEKLYKKAEQDFPDVPLLIFRQAVLALTLKNFVTANDLIKKYISLSTDNSVSEATISTSIANIYNEANIIDKAEEYYRKALFSEPGNLVRINDLAYFLIDKDRNFNEGLDLVNKALEQNRDNYNFLDTKGYGLYKQGKYQEAYEILQKSWDLRMKNAVYDHAAFLHLEAAKKAVAGQKTAEN